MNLAGLVGIESQTIASVLGRPCQPLDRRQGLHQNKTLSGADVGTHFRVVKLHYYAEIKHSDLLFQIM